MRAVIRSFRSDKGGFTLIELMMVVAVIAILAAIAYPSYHDAVRKGRRGQAKADIMELMQLAERYRSVNGTYHAFGSPGTDGTLGDGWGKSPRTGTAYYVVKATTHTVDALVLEAQPISGRGQDADPCKALTLDATGKKGPSGSEAARCW